MDMGFAVTCPHAWHCMPQNPVLVYRLVRLLDTRFFQTLPRGYALAVSSHFTSIRL